jgi:hypothetical protein
MLRYVPNCIWDGARLAELGFGTILYLKLGWLAFPLACIVDVEILQGITERQLVEAS